jgi:nucleoid-associated protein YgaU
VLVFGVLLSDHFSRARTDTLISDEIPDEPLVIPAITLPPIVGASEMPVPRVAVSLPGGIPIEVAEPPVPGTAEPTVAVTAPAGDVPSGPPAASIFEPAPMPSPVPAVTGLLPGFVPVDAPRAAAATEPATTAERAVTHVVKEDETLFAISRRYYNDGHLWRDLARHNPDVVKADGHVGVGDVLKIPPRAQVDKRQAAAGTGVVASSDGIAIYKVREGDTLGEISLKLLGSVRRMDEIVSMNRDKIRDADDIRAGMELRYRKGPAA